MRAPHSRRLVAFIALALAWATPAHAVDGSTAGALELYPTFGAIGVRLAYLGDDNLNATAHLEWRKTGTATWTRGVDLARITSRRWAGSVMWLTPGRSYDVRAVIVDPEGGATATGAAATRNDQPPVPSGRNWYVAVNGNDAQGGGAADPLATLQAAADRAHPGDQILVRPGLYHQTVTLSRDGTPQAPIHLVADGAGVVLDGSDPAYLQRSDWRNDGGGIFSVPFAGVSRLVCVDSLQRLFHVATLAALQANTNGLGQGWVIEGGRLWVRLENGSSPVGRQVHVARHDIGIRMEADDWRVRGFEVRYFGTLFPDFDYVSGGITLIGARRCVVQFCHVHTIGGRNVFLRSRAADNLIEHNLVRDPRLGGWPWNVVKGTPDQELTGISNRADRGNVVRYNTIRNTFNGVDARIQEVGTDENVAADADFHDNVIEQIGDDAVEIDEVSGINVRVLRNRAIGIFSGISLAPVEQGPTYTLYNTFSNFTRNAFKPAGTSVGHVWACHNTCYGTVSGKAAVHPSGFFSNMHFRNNIMVSTGNATVSDDAGESQTGNDFDGDLLRVVSFSTLFRWKNVNYSSLAALRSATGFELGGIAADPAFVAPGAGDFRLQPTSPAIDAGIRLHGINDFYAGSAPDLGAYESGLPLAVAETAPGRPQIGRIYPNPMRGAATIDFVLMRGAPVRVEIVDLSGRVVRRLADAFHGPGAHRITWDGRDGAGGRVASGLYFARLAAGSSTATARIVKLD